MTNAEHLEMRVVSPELVLVDPELAAWCRLRLCEEAAAETARNAEPPAAPPTVTVLEFRSSSGTKPAVDSASLWKLLRRESVLVTAAVLLLGIAGAQSKPNIVAQGAPLTSAPPAPGIVITWQPIRNAQWYTARVMLGPTTIFWARELRQSRFLLPPSSAYNRSGFGYRVEVRAVVKAGPARTRTIPVQTSERVVGAFIRSQTAVRTLRK